MSNENVMLYETPDILTKIRSHLTPLFEGFTRPTTQTLIWIIVAMLALGGARSVRNLYTGFLADLDLVSLNTLYHALSYAKRPAKRFVGCAAAFCEPGAEEYLPLHFYRSRWTIEVIFYELKTFWSLGTSGRRGQ